MVPGCTTREDLRLTPSHGIRVVTFDADGTIWDFQTTMREALAVSLQSLQTLYPEQAAALTVDELIVHREEAEAAFRGKSMTMEGLRFAAFMRTLDTIGARDERHARDLTSSYLERRFASARIFDDVLPALDILQEHFRLGLLTNGNSYPDKLGLAERFEFVVVAQDHGVWKPDAEFYELAIQRAGVAPEEILHIGDRLDNDVLPARRAGMNVVWLNRTGDEPPTGSQAVATLFSLLELPAFLSLHSS